MGSAKEKELRDAFDAAIKAKLGDAVTDKDLEEKGASTPVYEVYDDDDDGEHPQQPEVIETTPEDADNYIGAEVELPQNGKGGQGRGGQAPGAQREGKEHCRACGREVARPRR